MSAKSYNPLFTKFLFTAIKHDAKEKDIEPLFGQGAEINAKDADCKGNTPLHFAVLGKNIEIVKYLLQKDDIDTTIRNDSNQTAAELAEQENLPDIAKTLADFDSAKNIISLGKDNSLKHFDGIPLPSADFMEKLAKTSTGQKQSSSSKLIQPAEITKPQIPSATKPQIPSAIKPYMDASPVQSSTLKNILQLPSDDVKPMDTFETVPEPSSTFKLPAFPQKKQKTVKTSTLQQQETLLSSSSSDLPEAIEQRAEETTFPTSSVLAQLSLAVSKIVDKIHILPDGWQLLTAEKSADKSSGYVGAVYFNLDRRQIVIAHRCCAMASTLDEWPTVWQTKTRPQINSALTFTEKVLNLLIDLKNKFLLFHLSITGHSLGGWLAQITALFVRYLAIKHDMVCLNDGKRYDAHTETFDSPGCKETLTHIASTFNLNEEILNELDITNYVSAPNRVNTCNTHVGKLFRIFPVIPYAERIELKYNMATHDIGHIAECFNPISGLVKRDENCNLKMQTVEDWPSKTETNLKDDKTETNLKDDKTETNLKDDDYETFYKWAAKFNDYHSHPIRSTLNIDNNKFVYHTSKFNLSNTLSKPKSKVEIKTSIVNFQGMKISFDELINHENLDLLDNDALLEINSSEIIKIGSKLPPFELDYYTEPTVYCRKLPLCRLLNENAIYAFSGKYFNELNTVEKIKQVLLSRMDTMNELDIFSICTYKDYIKATDCSSNVIILDNAQAKEQYENLCKKVDHDRVHWLQYLDNCRGYLELCCRQNHHSEQLLWRNSKGSLDHLKFCKLRISLKSWAKELQKHGGWVPEKCIDDIQEKVVVIRGAPGIGHSNLFYELAKRNKAKDPSVWVIFIDLLTIKQTMKSQVEKFAEMKLVKENVVDFLLEALNMKSDLEIKLFKQYLLNCETPKVVVYIENMVESRSELYEKGINNVLKELTTMNIKQIWMSYQDSFNGYYGSDWKYYYTTYENSPYELPDDQDKLTEFCKSVCSRRQIDEKHFTYHVLEIWKSVNFWMESSLLTPLLIEMFAEIYSDENVQTICSANQESKVAAIYNLFIQKKISDDLSRESNFKIDMKESFELHRKMAVLSVFPEDFGWLFSEWDHKHVLKVVKLIEIGSESSALIEKIVNGVPRFVHHTFADYLTVHWFSETIISHVKSTTPDVNTKPIDTDGDYVKSEMELKHLFMEIENLRFNRIVKMFHDKVFHGSRSFRTYICGIIGREAIETLKLLKLI